MKNLILYLQKQHIESLEKPLSEKEVLRLQKRLYEALYPALPTEIACFLKEYNGIRTDQTTILGHTPKMPETDLLAFNKLRNFMPNTLILGHDEFSFMLYDEDEKKYLLIDKGTSEVVEVFEEDESEFALNSIVH